MKSDYLFFEGRTDSARSSLRRQGLKTPRLAIDPPPAERGFFTFLLGHADLEATHYRSWALGRRTAACLRTLGSKTIDDALRKLRTKPEMAQAALNSVLLGVTEFFRDGRVFEALRFLILPQLLQRYGKLRVWSAACSEGQELYSVAMLLAEEGALSHCELLGTDCRQDAVRQARCGVFSTEAVAKLPWHWRRNFFNEDEVNARINSALVKATSWKTADLFRSVEAGPWHLILWRNMAIYVEPSAAGRIWQRLADELAPGGFLVTGKADHPPTELGLVRVAGCIFQKPEASS